MLEQTSRILERLQCVKPKTGGGWMAQCPAHDDERSSLSIDEGTDGKILLCCYAGCSVDKILSTINLTFSDMFPPKDAQTAEKWEEIKGTRQIITTYDYVDESGKLLFQAIRYSCQEREKHSGKTRHSPKNFTQRRPDGNGGWIYEMKGVRRVLYHLPEMLEAMKQGKTVSLVEGEKDVDRLHQIGMAATCNSQGAGKWLPEYSEALRGANVVIIPDNDDPGRRHRDIVAKALFGIAASVRILELPGLPPKGDVSDWLDAGGTVEKLAAMAKMAPLWLPPASMEEPPAGLVCLANVQSERVKWFWKDRVLFGKLNLLDGDPSLGKTTIGLDMAAKLSQGWFMPNEVDKLEPANCLILSAEDGVADTIKPRLEVAGADLKRIFFLDSVPEWIGDEKNGKVDSPRSQDSRRC